MNPINQSATHPDTESLNAFVEQVLPPTEREQILAHMATCGRCRQVVYLAQQAGVGPIEHVPEAVPQPPAPRRSWLASWRLAWIPAAALAGFVGYAVLHHSQVEQRKQLARNVPPMAATLAPPSQLESASSNKAAAPATRDKAPAPMEKQALPKPLSPPIAAPEIQTSLRESAISTFATGSGRGGSSNAGLAPTARLDAPRKASSLGGPMAANQNQQQNTNALQSPQQNVVVNQLQVQNANANQLQQQNSAALQQLSARQQLQSGGIIATGASRKVEAGDKKETKVVSADALSANAPAAMAQVEVAPLAKKDENEKGQVVSALKAKTAAAIKLPNGTAALSVASAQGRTVAVDPTGNVFCIESPSTQWIPVTRQWTGRAILVRTHPAVLHDATSPAPPSPVFELMNDNIQTWVSFDGKVWQPQTLPPQ